MLSLQVFLAIHKYGGIRYPYINSFTTITAKAQYRPRNYPHLRVVVTSLGSNWQYNPVCIHRSIPPTPLSIFYAWAAYKYGFLY